MVKTLPQNTVNLIKHYQNLKIGKGNIQCPYFQNILKKKLQPVFVGKGSPENIEREATKVFEILNRDPNKYSSWSLRYNLVMAGLGIDCSGFVARVLNSLLIEKGMGEIQNNVSFPGPFPLNIIRRYLRSYTNLSADTLSSEVNCVKIENHNDILPGDLIRMGSKHVAIISEVEVNNNKICRLTYHHSTWDYADLSGVRSGNIYFDKESDSLEKQRWDEIYLDNNWALQDYLSANPNDRGIRRLKSLA